MKDILDKLLKIIHEEKELKKARTRLALVPIDYEALQMLINKVDAENVVIEIQQTDGTIVRIKKDRPEQFKSFKDKFNERNK